MTDIYCKNNKKELFGLNANEFLVQNSGSSRQAFSTINEARPGLLFKLMRWTDWRTIWNKMSLQPAVQ